MIDNGSVPVEYLESEVFSIDAGQSETIQVASSTIPTYAFVGTAKCPSDT